MIRLVDDTSLLGGLVWPPDNTHIYSQGEGGRVLFLRCSLAAHTQDVAERPCAARVRKPKGSSAPILFTAKLCPRPLGGESA